MVALDMVATSTLPLHVITTGPMNTASSCLELKCIVGSRVFNAENVYFFDLVKSLKPQEASLMNCSVLVPGCGFVMILLISTNLLVHLLLPR